MRTHSLFACSVVALLAALPCALQGQTPVIGSSSHDGRLPAAVSGLQSSDEPKPLFYGIHKGKMYVQAGDTNPVLSPTNAWFFGASVDPMNSGLITNAGVVTPSGVTQEVVWDDSWDMFAANRYFQSKAELDVEFPLGTYFVDVAGAVNQRSEITLPTDTNVDAYPPPLRIANFDGAQRIRADSDFLLAWDSENSTDCNGRIRLAIFYNQRQLVWATLHDEYLPCQATSITIPSHALRAGSNYTGLLMNMAVVWTNRGGEPDVHRDASYYASTSFRLTTLPAVGVCLHSTIALVDVSEVEICWESSPNLTYQVQYRTDLDTGVWIDLSPRVTATGPRMCVTHPVDGPSRFFRVLGPDMAWIPLGTFTMGSPPEEPARQDDEGPQTEVTISRGFWMGRHEVTQGEYLEVVGSNPSFWRNGATGEMFGGSGGPVTDELRHPVENVTWFEATNYCGLLTERERLAGRLPTGYGYRLPTEAQWEYACRAGTMTPFSFGSELRSGNGYVNFDGHYEYPPCGDETEYCYNPSGIYLGRTAEVGSYAPNAWGLCDMHGNVWEWCVDWWANSLPGGSVTDPEGPASGSTRVHRGGGWNNIAHYCRSAYRDRSAPEYGFISVGFRVALVAVR
jgi:sulfatase modifying factor 1